MESDINIVNDDYSPFRKIRTLCVRFNTPLAMHEIPLFRGAIISAVTQSETLFHNHIDDSFRYRYPLIQYKRIGKNAAIVCVEDGVEAFGNFFESATSEIMLGERAACLEVASVTARQELIQIWDSMFSYHLNSWIALNQTNYKSYRQMDGIAEKMAFLEKILTGNILSMAKSMGIHFDNEIKTVITDVAKPRDVLYKNTKVMSFDISFKCNVSLPNYIGIGKGCSIGYGIIKKQYSREDGK